MIISSFDNNQSDDWHHLASVEIPCLQKIHIKDTSEHLYILGIARTYTQGVSDPPSLVYRMDYVNFVVERVQELPSALSAAWWDDILTLLPVEPEYTGTQPVYLYSQDTLTGRFDQRNHLMAYENYTVAHHLRVSSWDCLILAEAPLRDLHDVSPTDIVRVENVDLVPLTRLNVPLLSIDSIDSIQHSDFTLLAVSAQSQRGLSPVRTYKLTKQANKLDVEELHIAYPLNCAQQYPLSKFIMVDEVPHLLIGSINEQALLFRFESDKFELVQVLAMNSALGAIHIQNRLLVMVRTDEYYQESVSGSEKMVFELT